MLLVYPSQALQQRLQEIEAGTRSPLEMCITKVFPSQHLGQHLQEFLFLEEKVALKIVVRSKNERWRMQMISA